MNDILSPLTVPPPRYLLESDSSDEEGEGQYPGSSSRTTRAPIRERHFSLDTTAEQIEYESILIGVGQAGKYIARLSAKEKEKEVVRITDDQRRIGRGWRAGETLIIDIEESDVRSGWEIARVILAGYKAKKWIVMCTYLPALYIPDTTSKAFTTPPIRHLNILGQDIIRAGEIKKYTSPNYISGLAGAFGALASHPVSPISSFASVALLLLPLPLSSISTQALSASLEVLGLNVGINAGWGEDDDEPYVGPGVGNSSHGKLRVRPGEETGGMYM